ncbi:MAG: hypothetical protein ABIS30_00160 [Gallionella sp.]
MFSNYHFFDYHYRLGMVGKLIKYEWLARKSTNIFSAAECL